MSIKETNLDKVIEEEIIQQKKVDEKIHVKFEDETEIDNEEVEVENKPDKPKKKLSIFRKSKKNKVNKNKETDELKTELLVAEDNSQENESKVNDSDNQTKEPENKFDVSDDKTKDVPEKKSLFKRRSVKTKVVDEDVSTQTGQAENTDKNPTDTTDLNDEEEKLHKERKRSFVKRISKLRKSSKWTNTSEEKNEGNKEVRPEEKEVKPEETIENHEDSFHDLAQEPTTSGNQDENKLDSPDNVSVETFIVKDNVDNIAPENPFVEKDISLNMSNEKNDIEEDKEVESQFQETYESEFTTVTALPDRSFEEEDPVTVENMTKDNSVDKTEMEEIPLLSDTQLAECSSTQDPSDISISSEEIATHEEKPKNLNFVLVGPLNNKEKDESFFLAKKAVKVYKNAQLSRTYCQSCCTLM